MSFIEDATTGLVKGQEFSDDMNKVSTESMPNCSTELILEYVGSECVIPSGACDSKEDCDNKVRPTCRYTYTEKGHSVTRESPATFLGSMESVFGIGVGNWYYQCK